MKKEDLILLGAVAVGVFVMARYLAGRTSGTGTSEPATNTGIVGPNYATEIMRNNGWSYYTDGTSIDPDGRYYKGSTLVYDPKGMFQ